MKMKMMLTMLMLMLMLMLRLDVRAKRLSVDDIRLDVYDQWREVNVSGTRVLDGYISWPPPLKKKTRFSMLPGIMSRDEVRRVLELVDPVGKPRLALNENLDTVDSMKAHEIFIHQGDIDGGGGEEDAATKKNERRTKKLKTYSLGRSAAAASATSETAADARMRSQPTSSAAHGSAQAASAEMRPTSAATASTLLRPTASTPTMPNDASSGGPRAQAPQRRSRCSQAARW